MTRWGGERGPGVAALSAAAQCLAVSPAADSSALDLAPIAAVVLSVVVTAGLGIGAYVISTKDFPSIIQDGRLVDVIKRECDIMTSTVDSMPLTGSPTQQLKILADQNRAVTKMLGAIRAVDPDVRRADPPTNDWLADWDRLIQAREAFAELVERGFEPRLRIPRDASGDRIQLRMNDVWLDASACKVPSRLLNPYREDVSDI